MNRLHAKLEKIGSDPKLTAKAVGLRYVANSVDGYSRKALVKFLSILSLKESKLLIKN